MKYLKTYKIFESGVQDILVQVIDSLHDIFDDYNISKFEGRNSPLPYYRPLIDNLLIEVPNDISDDVYRKVRNIIPTIESRIGWRFQMFTSSLSHSFCIHLKPTDELNEDIKTSLENDRFNPIISDITLDIVDNGFKVEPVYGFDPDANEHYLLIHINKYAATGYKFDLVDIKPTIMELASQLKGCGFYFNRMETTCSSIVQVGPSDKEFKTNAYMSDEIGPGDTNKDINNMLDKHISDVGDRKCEYVQLFFIF